MATRVITSENNRNNNKNSNNNVSSNIVEYGLEAIWNEWN